MYYVYVLFSHHDRKLYIGFTNNLKQRFHRHVSGYVHSTKYRRPLSLIYYEAYGTRSEAKQRERYLKGGNGRQQLKVQLHLTLRQLRYRHL